MHPPGKSIICRLEKILAKTAKLWRHWRIPSKICVLPNLPLQKTGGAAQPRNDKRRVDRISRGGAKYPGTNEYRLEKGTRDYRRADKRRRLY
nr:unnamed protein product [Callosobruchus analis]